MNRHLFDLVRRIEEGARRLASTITHSNDKPVRDIGLVGVEMTEIENALAEFKREVAGGVLVVNKPASVKRHRRLTIDDYGTPEFNAQQDRLMTMQTTPAVTVIESQVQELTF